MKEPSFVVIGGGTGSFTVLSALKQHTANITALVNMSDDGGSTGVLRDELGVLPPGDVRQCLVALSESSQLRDLFNYRFTGGRLSGHSFGNLFLSATEKMTDNFEEAVRLASKLLRIKGEVVPVTTDKCHLVLTYPDGRKLKGEHVIGNMDLQGNRSPQLCLEPQARITSRGARAIARADVVVIAPGNLYGSLAPALLVEGMREALMETNARIVFICNLVNKPGQTDDFMVHDYVLEIERFIGADVIDVVIFNTDEPPKRLLERYVRDGEHIVEFDLDLLHGRHEPIGLPLVAGATGTQSPGDRIAHKRSLIRHDAEKLAEVLIRIAAESST